MSDDCLNIFLQKHQIPFEGTRFDNITREQLAKSFSTTILEGFYKSSFEEQKLLLTTLKQIRHSFSPDFTQKLHSKYLHGSFFDREKYMEELYKVTQIGLNYPPIGNGVYLQLIHLMLRNLEQRQYVESGWFRSMMFDFYDCMFKIIIHSPAPDAVVETQHDKKTEISTPDKNNDDDDLKLGKQFDYDKKTEISRPHKREILSPDKNNDEKSFEKMSYIDHLLRRYGLQYNKNRDHKQENPTKNTDSKKGGNKKNKKTKKIKKQKNKKTKRKY
jgi:hypothetical protein